MELISHRATTDFYETEFEVLKLNTVYRGDAEQIDEFLAELEIHLDIHGITNNREKIAAFVNNISGPPALWYGTYRREALAAKDQSMLHYDNIIISFKKTFRAPFIPLIYEKWTTLKQTGTLNEYTLRFQRLLNIISQDMRLDHKVIVFRYSAGLRKPLKGLVRNRKPSTLMEAIKYAAANAEFVGSPPVSYLNI